MQIIDQLTESHVFTSKTAFRKYSGSQLIEILYTSVLAFRILSRDHATRHDMLEYAQHTWRWKEFDKWRTNATDLYYLVYLMDNLSSNDDMSLSSSTIDKLRSVNFRISVFSDIVRAISAGNESSNAYFKRFLLRLDNDLSISNSTLRSIRRLAMNWDDITKNEKRLAVTRLLQIMHQRIPLCDLTIRLNDFAHHNDLLVGREEERTVTLTSLIRQHNLNEELCEDDGGGDASSAAGATTSADIAGLAMPLGKVRRRK